MISLVSAVIAVTGAVFTAGIGFWWQSRLKSVERQDYMSRYRDSLLWVAFDLQSRIYNILFGHVIDRETSGSAFMQELLIEGTDRQAKYARFSTAYVFAEYLGWAEIFRRDIQFLDLGKNDRNRKVLLCLANISRTLSSARIPGISYRLFRADQRAIGELMIADDSNPGNRWCLGYAEFTRKILQDDELREWTEELFEHIDRAARHPDEATERLLRLQYQLVELVDRLDPDRVRFPAAERTRFPSTRLLAELEPYQVGQLGTPQQGPSE
ncbi:hypothetical protein J7I98_40445 [Streptomyces sp. ISL-98]|uniref:hypothetical protein n=1 Tax=Streptomyces sp. ISL-98 TaxID=2819192 RepID=UPI001BE85375|nr:hypothetical protein [Streptomyces sp. ISL-98]MBT2511911.1 hypothetical protein [Streptomyces sp. ISL-98]